MGLQGRPRDPAKGVPKLGRAEVRCTKLRACPPGCFGLGCPEAGRLPASPSHGVTSAPPFGAQKAQPRGRALGEQEGAGRWGGRGYSSPSLTQTQAGGSVLPQPSREKGTYFISLGAGSPTSPGPPHAPPDPQRAAASFPKTPWMVAQPGRTTHTLRGNGCLHSQRRRHLGQGWVGAGVG